MGPRLATCAACGSRGTMLNALAALPALSSSLSHSHLVASRSSLPFLRNEGGMARATVTTNCLDPQTGVLTALFGAGTTALGFDVVQPSSISLAPDLRHPGRLVTLRATLEFPAVHGTEYHMWIKVYNGIGLPVTLGLHPAPTYFGTPPTVLPWRCVPESRFVNPQRTPPQLHTGDAVVEPNSWLTGGNVTVALLCPQRTAVSRVYTFAGVPPVDFVVDVAAEQGRQFFKKGAGRKTLAKKVFRVLRKTLPL